MLHSFEKIAAVMSLLTTATLCAQIASPSVAPGAAEVAGVVRDVRGVPQMGVLVELLGGGISATALTDLQGRYHLDAQPGIYQLRASATLYLPAVRRQLRVRPGMKPIVNLTMSGLFQDSEWLPIQRQVAGESADDWKWTLKSPVSRPMLRLVGDEDLPATGVENGQHGETRVRLTAGAASGGFGSSGGQGMLVLAHRSGNGKVQTLLRSGVATPDANSGVAPKTLSALIESGADTPMQRRVSGRVRSFPQIRTANGESLNEIEFSTAERIGLGDLAAVEVGSETQILRADRAVMAVHPFLRVSAQPSAGWTVTYMLATSPRMESFDDVGSEDATAPTLAPSARGPLTEASLHQALRLQRSLGRVKLQGSVHQDSQRRPAISGMFTASAVPSGVEPVGFGSGLAVDYSNGIFRGIGPRFVDNGCSLLADFPIGDQVTVSGGYLNSVGLAVLRNTAGAGELAPRRSQAGFVSVQGRVKRTGTRVATTYRWQPGSLVGVLSPYEAQEASPYLSVHLRQKLPRSGFLPSGAEVTVDAVNVAGEGYQQGTMISADALLASALRELRAGVAFTF